MSLFGERLNSMLKYKYDPVISCCCQQSYKAASGTIAAETEADLSTQQFYGLQPQ
jgi:hypothetical protein